MEEANDDSACFGPQRERKLGGRKEPEEEFFSMTLVAQIMAHPMQNLIIDMITDAGKLYNICKQTSKKPFFLWPVWIADYITKQLERIK